MVFTVSAAKQEILQKLAERDWTPAGLAEELGKSQSTIYNHLHDLEEQGLLTTWKVEAKTRPKTVYSIGDGLIQYVAVLPGQFKEGSLSLDPLKEAVFRIWMLPQSLFQPYVIQYWWNLQSSADIAFEDVTALAVFGSVARGEASEDSDIDLLVIAEEQDTADILKEQFGSVIVETEEGSKICMTEIFTQKEYRNSVAHGSYFFDNITGDLHVVYDPNRILLRPETVVDQ